MAHTTLIFFCSISIGIVLGFVELKFNGKLVRKVGIPSYCDNNNKQLKDWLSSLRFTTPVDPTIDMDIKKSSGGQIIEIGVHGIEIPVYIGERNGESKVEFSELFRLIVKNDTHEVAISEICERLEMLMYTLVRYRVEVNCNGDGNVEIRKNSADGDVVTKEQSVQAKEVKGNGFYVKYSPPIIDPKSPAQKFGP